MFFVGVDIEYFFPHNMSSAYIRINVVVRWAIGGGLEFASVYLVCTKKVYVNQINGFM